MSVKSMTRRFTESVVRYRRRIFWLFIVVWVVLLATLLFLWIFRVLPGEFLDASERLTFNLVYLAYLVVNQLSMLLGYLIWRKDHRLLQLTIFLTLVSILALVPIVFLALPVPSATAS